MENKNTIIALLLVMALWFGYNTFFPPAPVQQSAGTAESSPEASPASATAPDIAAAVLPVSPTDPPGFESIEQYDVVVETPHFKAVLNNHGARLKEFILKDYREGPARDSSLMHLIEEGPSQHSSLQTVGLDGFPLSENTPFVLEGDSHSFVLQPGNETSLRFIATLDNGSVLEKVFLFRADSYDFDVQLRLHNASTLPLQGALALSLVNHWDDSMAESRYDFVGPMTFDGEDINNDDVSDLEEEGDKNYGDFQWTSFTTKYFISILAPEAESSDQLILKKGDDSVLNTVKTPFMTLSPGDSQTFSFLVYMGPKDLDLLKTAGHNLEQAIDYGFFAPIARPLLHFLKFIYRYLGNYGLAIILLTVIIKALFWPLTQKSYSSMKAMQKLQPQMQKLREKYKNDRERMNRELMELYKENRVNPMGGCLPMVIQIPVFFALYKVLLASIELRHAPFAFWLTDLSAKDPYYITPLVMGATMFLQQKMSPTTMDPNQAKIFMIMPVVFTFLFLNFPSGLVIYWLVNNILTIVQQMLINRQSAANG